VDRNGRKGKNFPWTPLRNMKDDKRVKRGRVPKKFGI